MARWTIERRVPLLATALVLSVVGVLALAAYREVATLTVGTAQDRVAGRARDFADLAGRGIAGRLKLLDSAARDTAVARFVRSRGHEGQAGAQSVLRRLAGNGPARALTVLDPLGHVLLSTDSTVRRAPSAEDAVPVAGITPLYPVDSAVAYRNARPIATGSGPPGWLVERTRVISSTQSRQGVRRLFGSDAHLLYGNATGGVWLDVSGRLPGPTGSWDPGRPFTYGTPNNGTVLATAVPVTGTPWVILVGLSEADIRAPVRTFLRNVALVALILVLVGGLVSWRVSRTITAPLRRVGEAASAIAAGELTTRAPMIGNDEVTDLARAFNVMVERVATSTHTLELQVAERTKALARQVSELEAVNQEIETFSYSVSHDLRAPLRAIDGFSQILETDHGPGLDPEARRVLGVIRKSAQRMGQLVDDLLRFSRLGRKGLVLKITDMTALARGAWDEQLTGHTQRPRVSIAELPPAVIDATLVLQVWSNLLGNAVKYAANRAQSVIEVGARPERDNGHNVYFVRDNGVGFDPAYADKLFGVFQRLHRDDEFEGTGVGLAIVQRIVHRHGGRVWAEGQPDVGATFYFTLPAEGAAS